MLVGVLVAAGGVVLKMWRRASSPERLRREIGKVFAEHLQGRLAMGQVSLSPGGVLRVDDVEVFPAEDGQALVQLARLVCALDRGELLRGRALPTRATVERPHLSIRQGPGDRWNLDGMLGRPLPAAATLPPRFLQDGLLVTDGAVSVQSERLFGDVRVRQMGAVTLSADRHGAGAGGWHIRGDIGGGALRGTTLDGRLTLGPPRRFELRATSDAVRVDREFLWELPPFGKSIWRLLQPQGPFGLALTLTSSADGGLGYAVTLRPRGVDVLTRFFPARITSVGGTVDVTQDKVVFRNVSGLIRPAALGLSPREALPAHVTAQGVYYMGTNALDLRLDAVDVPLCKRSVEAIPEQGKRIWDELRPTGNIDLLLTLNDLGTGRPTRFVATVRLKGATVRVPGYPFTAEKLSGEVVIRDDGVYIPHLAGLIRSTDGSGGTAPMSLSGVYDPTGRETNLELTVKDLPLDRQTTVAIPELGKEFWELLRAEGRVDATLVMRGSLERGGLKTAMALTIRSGRAVSSFYPVAVQDLTGSLYVEEGMVRIAGLDGRLVSESGAGSGVEPLGSIGVRGMVDVAAHSGSLHVDVTDLRLCREIVEKVPNAGKTIWDQARPEGLAALSGRFVYEEGGRLSYSLNVRPQRVSVFLRKPGLWLRSLSGDMLLTERELNTGSLTALVAGGTVNGALFARFGSRWQDVDYQGSVAFRAVDLAELLEELAGTDHGLAGRLSGLIDLRGGLGADAPLSASGTVELADGHLGTIPLFAGVMDVLHLTLPSPGEALGRGSMSFNLVDKEMAIKSIEAASPGFELSGDGKVNLDGKLDLRMVAATLPGGGIPILSSALRLILSPVEREFAKFHVTGTLGDPTIEHVALSTITRPVTGVFRWITGPFRGDESEDDESP